MSNAPRDPFFPADQPIRTDAASPLEVRRLGTVDYQEALDLQVDLADRRRADTIGDTLLVLEHPSVYTAGKRTQPEDMPDNGLPVIEVNRGGRITWHGEGQLVLYPIIKLADPIDVVDYVRRLEEALIQVVSDAGVPGAGRIDGRSGVWVPASSHARDRKIAAIGIRIARGVTSHGVALNCCNTLEYFDHIVPCGISDAGVTTLSEELGRTVTVEEMTDPVIEAVDAALAGRLVVADHTFGSAPNPGIISKRRPR